MPFTSPTPEVLSDPTPEFGEEPAGVSGPTAGNARWRQSHGAADMEAHGPILALIGARSGREPLTALLASSGGWTMRWGRRGMTPTLLSRQQGIISR